MTKRALIILIAAVLAVGFATVAIATSIGGDDSNQPGHTMPGGETMEGESMEGMEGRDGGMDMNR